MPETHNITQAYMEFQAEQIEGVLNAHKLLECCDLSEKAQAAKE